MKKKGLIIALIVVVLLGGTVILYTSNNIEKEDKKNTVIEDKGDSLKENCIYVDASDNTNSDCDIIRWYKKEGEEDEEDIYYLFLPSTCNKEHLIIYSTFSDTVKINEQKIISGEYTDVFSTGDEFKVIVGEKTYKLKVEQDKKLPSIFIKTDKGDIDNIDNSDEVTDSGKILVVSNDESQNYNSTFKKLKIRGNSTRGYEKKPYNITLDENTEILGMTSSKKWTLIANYRDKSLLRNEIIYNLGASIGIDYTPEVKQVNLYIDGDYRGTYTICQKVEVGNKSLVKIHDLEQETEKLNSDKLDSYGIGGNINCIVGTNKYYNIPNEPDNISDGYLLEVELSKRYSEAQSGFVTNNKMPISLKSPKYASKSQVEYISKYYEEFEDALYSSDGYNAKGKYYTDYIDLESFAKMYLLQEFCKNVDGGNASFFIYKDTDEEGESKLHAAVPWDYDLAIGNYKDKFRDCTGYEGFYVRNNYTYEEEEGSYSIPTIFNMLFYHKEFQDMVVELWNDFYNSAESILNSIDSYEDNIESSANMNFIRYDILEDTTTNCDTGSTFEDNVKYVYDFLQNRLQYMNGYYNKDIGYKTIYFDNSNSKFKDVYAYVFTGSAKDGVVVPMESMGNNIYRAQVIGTYTDIVFKDTMGITSWENQSGDLNIPTDNNNCYKPDTSENRSSGSWISIMS